MIVSSQPMTNWSKVCLLLVIRRSHSIIPVIQGTESHSNTLRDRLEEAFKTLNWTELQAPRSTASRRQAAYSEP